jgi:transposase
MGKGNFTEEFKRDAVRQITERGYPAAEVSQRVGGSQHSLYEQKSFTTTFSTKARHAARKGLHV